MRGLTAFQCGILLFGAFLSVRAEEGPCTYEEDYCSCKYIDTNLETCWDRVSGTPSSGACVSRSCLSGWACTCPGRTHLCNVRDVTVTVLDEDQGAGNGICHDESTRKAANWSLNLGSFTPSFSRKGLLANACNQVAIWHNGELLGNYGNDPEITSSNIDEELERRNVHTLLELRPDDLLAFRFKNASYHCFNSFASFSVNGTSLDTSSTGVRVHFARKHSDAWQQPSFVPTYAADEATANITDFISIRTQMFSGSTINPGDDLWEYDDGSSRDHHTSNFYYRVQL